MKIENISSLGPLIRARRKEAGLTLETFAAMLGYSPRLLSDVERGQRNVSFNTALTICALLGIDIIAAPRGGNK